MARLIKYFMVSLLAICLAGCGSEQGHADLQQLINDLKKQAVKTENLIDRFQFKEKSSAFEEIARNPFPEQQTKVQERVVNTQSPLEQYPLDTLKLLGVIRRGAAYTAVLLAPDSKIYQANVGDSISTSQGRITQITDTQIVVEEPVNIELGRLVSNTKILQLKGQ